MVVQELRVRPTLVGDFGDFFLELVTDVLVFKCGLEYLSVGGAAVHFYDQRVERNHWDVHGKRHDHWDRN
jgi:hypothetical protein